MQYWRSIERGAGLGYPERSAAFSARDLANLGRPEEAARVQQERRKVRKNITRMAATWCSRVPVTRNSSLVARLVMAGARCDRLQSCRSYITVANHEVLLPRYGHRCLTSK